MAGCVGKCLDQETATEYTDNDIFDLDTYCPTFECDGTDEKSTNCLGDDPEEALSQHTGIAPGAKLAIFDASFTGDFLQADLAGNTLWSVTLGTGAMVHTNSWGADSSCTVDEKTILYDTFMYQVKTSP